MMQEIEPPLGPPPRKAHYRRGIRNARRGYRTLCALVIFVFAGWAALDVIQWHDLANGGSDNIRAHTLNLAIGHGLVAIVTLFVLRFIERPVRRELRLARRGEVAPGQLLAIRPSQRRRGLPSITYSYRTPSGATIESSCTLPRRVRVADLAPGTAIEILYEPGNPKRNKPRLAFGHVDFGEIVKKKPA